MKYNRDIENENIIKMKMNNDHSRLIEILSQ